MKNNKKILQLTQTAIMAAAAIVLAAIENMLPNIAAVSLPGAKLGLSNIASMMCANILGLPSAFAVSVIKSLFVLCTRGVTAFLLSLCGGVGSTVVMWFMMCCFKTYPFGYIGVGVMGAATHNFLQLLVVSAFVGSSVWAYALYLMPAAVAAGSVTGFTMGIILPKIQNVKFWQKPTKG